MDKTWFDIIKSQDGAYVVRKCSNDGNFYKTSYENVVENLSCNDEAEIFKEGFKCHPACKNAIDLKATLALETPENLASRYCLETFTGTGLHNAPKFFAPQTISWWLGTMMARGIYFDFEQFKYETVIEIFRALGKKVYDTYA